MVAATRTPSRAEAVFLLNQLERIKAAGAGPAGGGDIQWLDAIGAKEARTWLDWRMTHPQLVEAIRNRSHPAHAVTAAAPRSCA